MPVQPSAFVKSYNSFSGVDIKGTFANVTIAELQAISYSITREKAPIYTMGSPEPRAYARGKRGIAGTVIFIMFDRHALLDTLGQEYWMKFQSDIDDIRPEFRGGQNRKLEFSLKAGTDSAVTPSTPVGGGIGASPSTIQQESDVLNFVDEDQEPAYAWYVDQIPPFDITLTAANEAGSLAAMKIFGVEILNEGYGVSIDDLVSEFQCTFVARSIMPWRWVRPNDYFTLRTTS